ncbi:unnamed protein product [Mytilus coruscus]|uniref:Uncharacterized protein n=1 Tax=Mytilus coruscus TaxID=42192 RepID=A0A6J8ALQ8_MYTCO|nr:unnamed protein product [Mytilus coruscus]
MQSRGFTVELSSKKDVRLDHNLTIEEFNRAFRKYRNIMGKAYPQKKVELEQYEADIKEISQNYSPCFYTYHKMFSAKAAAAIVEHNISRACAHCGEFDHTSKFCEKAKHGIPTLSQGATPIRNIDKRVDRFPILQGQNSVTTTIMALAIAENASSCMHVVNVGKAGMA